MNVPVKLAAYSALLAIVFVAALGIGRAVGPIDLHTPSHEVNSGEHTDQPTHRREDHATPHDGAHPADEDTMKSTMTTAPATAHPPEAGR